MFKLVQVQVKSWSKHVVQHCLDQISTYKLFFVGNPSSSVQGERYFWKQKKQKTQDMDQCLAYKRANLGPAF